MKYVATLIPLLCGVHTLSTTASFKREKRTDNLLLGLHDENYFGLGSVDRLRSDNFSQLYTHNWGCFSRKNLEWITKQNDSKVFIHPNSTFKSRCIRNCDAHFNKFPEKVGLIAVQHQMCACFFLPLVTNVQFLRLNDTFCKLKTDQFYAGGNFALSIYCKFDSLCPAPKYEVIDSDPPVDIKIENFNFAISSYRTMINSSNTLCNSADCTVTFDSKGEICGTFNKSVMQFTQNGYSSTVLPFLNTYIPQSMENPALCIQHCHMGQKYGVYGTHRDVSYRCSIISSVRFVYLQKDEPQGQMVQCHCVDRLPSFTSIKIQHISQCDVNSTIYSPDIDVTTKVHCKNITEPAEPRNSNSAGVRTASCDQIKCRANDNFGEEWISCSSGNITRNCSNFGDFKGTATWECSPAGHFIGEQPILSCWSVKLHDIMESSTIMTDAPEVAKQKLRELKDLVRPSGGKSQYLGSEILTIHDMVREQVENTRNVTLTLKDRENITTDAVGIIGSLIASTTPWRQLKSRIRLQTATKLLFSIEDTLFSLTQGGADDIYENTTDIYTKTVNPVGNLSEYSAQGFVVTVSAFKNHNLSVKYPPDSKTTYIRALHSLNALKQQVEYVGMLIIPEIAQNLTPSSANKLGEGFNSNSNFTFNGKVVSLSFHNKTIEKHISDGGIVVKFVHEVNAFGSKKIYFTRKLHRGEKRKAVLGETKCTFWNTTTFEWATDGCEKFNNSSNAQETICRCNHLTAFAVLTDLHDYVGKEKGLEMLTLILCPLSIFLLILTIVVLAKINILPGERATIIKHLCANLIVSNVLLLLFVDRNYFFLSQTSCYLVGVVTHYAFLVSFGWMAVEGFHLYGMLVVVFDSGKNYMFAYTVGAYCYPLLPIVLTTAIGYGIGDQPYGGEMFCWLNGNYIVAFLLPVAVILCGNFAVMYIAISIVYKQKNSKIRRQCEMASNRKWLKGVFSITMVLGLTWIAGFFTFLDQPSFPFMSYIFTFFNASQGICIFVMFCATNEKVQLLVFEKGGRLRQILTVGKNSWISGKSSDGGSKQTTSTKLLDSQQKNYERNISQLKKNTTSEMEESDVSLSLLEDHYQGKAN